MKIALNNQTFQPSLTAPNKYRNSTTPPVNFTGKDPSEIINGINKSRFFEPIKKFFKPVTNILSSFKNQTMNSIAKGYAKLLNTKMAEKIIKITESNKIHIVKHISAFIGLIISGLYIQKTLTNDKLDPQKKTTLAINQGIVSALATTLGYTFDGFAGKKVEKFIRKFSAANINDTSLPILRKGIKGAASMIIFATMYRYVAPVVVTPIANHIGNKIQAKKEAEAKLALKA